MMTSEEAAQLVADAIEASTANDTDRTSDLIARLGADSDSARMLGICYAFAEAGHAALKVLFSENAPNIDRGGQWGLEQLVPGALDGRPEKTFALRFITAYCNGDRDTACALYRAALLAGAEPYARSICQLLIDVGGLRSAAIKHVEAGGQPT